MKKHILILGLILMFMGLVMNAQTTVSIPNSTEVEGAVVVPVEVSPDLGYVGSVSLHITYDETVLAFTGFSNNPFDGDPNFLTNLKDGEITVGWYSLSPVEITDKIFDLNFNYLGGTSAISFAGTNELTDSTAQIYNVSFVDGSVGPEPVTLSLSDESALPGDTVSVNLDALNLEDAGSMTLYIDFDPSVLTFLGVDNDSVGFTVSPTTTGGHLTLSWFDDTTPLTMYDGTLVDLVFEFAGGSSDVEFTSATEVTDAAGDPMVVALTNGLVKEPDISIIIPDVGAYPNSEVSVPLTGQLFDNVGSIDVKITYDASVITFSRFEDLNGGTVETKESVSGTVGTLSLAYINTSGLTFVEDVIGNLIFDVGDLDVGATSAIEFTGDEEVTDLSGAILAVDYMDGSVTVMNQAPYFTATPDGNEYIPEYYAETDTYKGYMFQYQATDPEGSGLTYTLVSGPTGAVLSSGGLFRWAPKEENGTYVIVVEISDGELSTVDSSTVTTGSLVDVEKDVIPTSYSLNQNYPNPFNPTTTINFAIPKQADVSLQIYNVLGQEVKTLVNKNMTAGYHTINFDASNLISGMYIYRIQANGIDGSNFVDVKKMLLVK